MPQGQNSNENTTETKTQGQGAAAQGSKAKKAKKAKEPKAPKAPRVKKERPAREKPAHMSKVDKVAAMLPALTADAQTLFTAANNMSTADMNALVAHLNISIRRRGVQAIAQGAAAGTKLEPGSRVRVKSGHPRFQGQQGTVSKVQRIRCYVRLDGRNKDDYFFIADVEPLNAAPAGNLAEVVTRLSATPTPVDISTIEDEDENTGPATKTG